MNAPKAANAARAVFLDRDGVIIEDTQYPWRPQDLILVPRAAEALRELHLRGFLLIVITNQSGVARGMFTLADVDRFHEHLRRELENAARVTLDDILVCPHLPEGSVPEFAIRCACRKPGTKLIEDAQQKFRLDLSRCWMVGDRESDIETGVRAGVPAVQIVSPHYPKQHPGAVVRVSNLWEAVAHLQ